MGPSVRLAEVRQLQELILEEASNYKTPARERCLWQKEIHFDFSPTMQLQLCGQRNSGGYSQNKWFSQMFLKHVVVITHDVLSVSCTIEVPFFLATVMCLKQDSVIHTNMPVQFIKTKPSSTVPPGISRKELGEEGRSWAKPLQQKKPSPQQELESILQPLWKSIS